MGANPKADPNKKIKKTNILLKNVRERKGETNNMLQTQEVINQMAEITGGTKKDAKAHLDAFKEVVVEAIERGEDVKLKGFVDFVTAEVAERKAKNPQDGSEVVVPAHRKASAKLSKSLRKQ